MIKLFTGENNFEIERRISEIITNFDGIAEKIDGSLLELNQMADLFTGSTLFADKRLIIIKYLSENKSVWTVFDTWIDRVPEEIDIVLVEPNPDKRTKTYKTLAKIASVQDFKLWQDYDYKKAENWTIAESKKHGLSLDQKSASALISRVGVDQWRIYRAIQKLAVLDKVDPEIVFTVIDPNITENIYELFNSIFDKNSQTAIDKIKTIKLHEDPYMIMGLLSSQAFQLLIIVNSTKSISEIAKDFGVNPYVLTKLQSLTRRLGPDDIKRVVIAFAEADEKLKTSSTDPWTIVERAILKAI